MVQSARSRKKSSKFRKKFRKSQSRRRSAIGVPIRAPGSFRELAGWRGPKVWQILRALGSSSSDLMLFASPQGLFLETSSLCYPRTLFRHALCELAEKYRIFSQYTQIVKLWENSKQHTDWDALQRKPRVFSAEERCFSNNSRRQYFDSISLTTSWETWPYFGIKWENFWIHSAPPRHTECRKCDFTENINFAYINNDQAILEEI